MVIQALSFAINAFDVKDFDINKERFIKTTRRVYNDLKWDHYDMRKLQIDFLKNTLNDKVQSTSEQEWMEYYAGNLSNGFILNIVNQLTEDERKQFNIIKPYRKRSIAEFMIEKTNSNDWIIKRIPVTQFKQTDAKLSKGGLKDYRSINRIFSDTLEEHIDHPDFQILLKSLSSLLARKKPHIRRLNLVAHHTYVRTTLDQQASNAPEGIHQDGYDYIVSALVIERHNVTGGKSIILGGDKTTRLLETTLRPGQGLLQADRLTELWHTVEPIIVASPNLKEGYRSSLGFDINVA